MNRIVEAALAADDAVPAAVQDLYQGRHEAQGAAFAHFSAAGPAAADELNTGAGLRRPDIADSVAWKRALIAGADHALTLAENLTPGHSRDWLLRQIAEQIARQLATVQPPGDDPGDLAMLVKVIGRRQPGADRRGCLRHLASRFDTDIIDLAVIGLRYALDRLPAAERTGRAHAWAAEIAQMVATNQA